MRHHITRLQLAGLLAATITFANFGNGRPAAALIADEPIGPSTGMSVNNDGGSVRVGIDATTLARGNEFANWPLIRLNGFMLPARMVTVRVNGNGPLNVKYDALESAPAAISPARAEVRKVRGEDGEWIENMQDLADQSAELPSAPVTVLRDGVMNGTRWAVVAVSTIYADKGDVRQVTKLNFRIDGAQSGTPQQVLASSAADQGPSLARTADSGSALTCADTAVQPHEPMRSALADPALRSLIWRMSVSKVGLQTVTASAAAGLPANIAINRMQVWRDGVQLPIEVIDANGNGVFDGSDEVRYFASVAGDRWNLASGYWLSAGSAATAAANVRMTVASEPPPGGGSNPPAGAKRVVLPIVQNMIGNSGSAFEEGEWRDLASARTFMYTNLDAGAGDHVFSRNWNAADGNTQIEEGIAARTVLPRAAGTSTFFVDGVRRNTTPAALDVRVGTATWSARATNTTGNLVWNATLSNSDPSEALAVRLAKAGGSGTAVVSYYLQRVRWERPVALNLAGGKSAVVITRAYANYNMTNVPAGTRVYDVTNPLATRILPITNNAFRGANGGRYAIQVPGASTLVPATSQYTAFADIASTAAQAQALYVAPDWAHAKTDELVAHRAANGYSARLVNLQSIYDWFGNGDVSPTAIRNYFRHARAAWAVKPVAATLVGDGSQDPFNRVKFDFCTAGGANGCTAGNDYVQPNILPPYLADVDHYIGETACEGCYARLDCNDPLQDPLPDMHIGRLSVLNATQLNTVVDKIIGYETAAETVGGGTWRTKAVYFADDTDDAGSFKDSNRLLAAGLPAMTKGYVDYGVGAINTPEAAKAAMTTMMNAGAGMVHYNGHGASTLWAGTPTLYTIGDAAAVNAAGKHSFLFAMTCQTSQFHRATDTSAGSIDETFQRNANGPVASFGPTGWDTVRAHELLAEGMYESLRSVTGPANYKTAGELAMAAYAYVYTLQQTGDVDTLRTYVILGDPLTKIRVKG